MPENVASSVADGTDASRRQRVQIAGILQAYERAQASGYRLTYPLAEAMIKARSMFWRAVIIWLFIALAETLQGLLRVRFLNRRIGDRHARQVGVLTGAMLSLGMAP